MFKFMKTKPVVPSDVKLEQIKEILFPKLELHTDKDNNKFYIDYSVDSNLDAVLNDLEEGFNDETCRTTIRKVSNRLFEIRKIMEAIQPLDTDVKYILVDDMDVKNVEDIQAIEDSPLDMNTKT